MDTSGVAGRALIDMLKAYYSGLTLAVHSSNEGILGGMPTD